MHFFKSFSQGGFLWEAGFYLQQQQQHLVKLETDTATDTDQVLLVTFIYTAHIPVTVREYGTVLVGTVPYSVYSSRTHQWNVATSVAVPLIFL
jgi:hypothetical protein